MTGNYECIVLLSRAGPGATQWTDYKAILAFYTIPGNLYWHPD